MQFRQQQQQAAAAAAAQADLFARLRGPLPRLPLPLPLPFLHAHAAAASAKFGPLQQGWALLGLISWLGFEPDFMGLLLQPQLPQPLIQIAMSTAPHHHQDLEAACHVRLLHH